MLEIRAALAAAKAATLIGLVLALLAMGAAGAEWIERRAPWGLAAQRDRLAASINGPKGYRAQVAGLTAARDGWMAANGRCEAARAQANAQASAAIGAASAARGKAASAAFDQGYAAGRVAGRKSCGGTGNETIPDHPGGDGAAAGRLRDSGGDFAAGWAAAANGP